MSTSEKNDIYKLFKQIHGFWKKTVVFTVIDFGHLKLAHTLISRKILSLFWKFVASFLGMGVTIFVETKSTLNP